MAELELQPATENEPLPVDPAIPAPTGGKPKRKKRESKKEVQQNDAILQANIFTLLKTVNSLAAVKLGEIWLFSDEEINAIAEPATRILGRVGASEIAGKYSDYFMLALALSMPIGVRVIYMQTLQEEKKNVSVPKQQTAARTEREVEAVSQNFRNNGGTLTDYSTAISDAAIAAIA